MPKTTYLYGITEDKFVRPTRMSGRRISTADSFRYIPSHILQTETHIDHNVLSIVFRVTPDSLLNLASKVVNEFPLPSVYTWTIEDICRWLRNYGYQQYQNTFRENLVNGHTLLLLDAAALSAMNIKDFDHIRDITRGIRTLYFYELAKYGRSISLAPENLNEMYKKFRVKTGRYYDTTKRTDFWRKAQLIREQRNYYDHWGALEHHLKIDPSSKRIERFGGIHRAQLYRCKEKPIETVVPIFRTCKCPPPCMCHWDLSNLRSNIRLSGSTYIKKALLRPTRLELLEKLYPHKYGHYQNQTFEFEIHSQIIHIKPVDR